MTGRLSGRCPIKIKEGFSVNPGATEYVELCWMDESKNGIPLSEPYSIETMIPLNRLSGGTSMLDDQPYELVIASYAAESPPEIGRAHV